MMKKNKASKVLGEGRASAKVLRQKQKWPVLGKERRQHGLGVVSKGRVEERANGERGRLLREC